MLITYRQLSKVTFPVYALPSDDWYSQDGLLFVEEQLVDDKNMSGRTLGIRRMQTFFKDLYPLRRSMYDTLALLKSGKKYFIDSLGKCFIYEKTKYCPLIYHRIKRVDKKEVASILWLHGLKFPFTIPRPPKPHQTWAGVLHLYNEPWLLYEYAEGPKKPSRKMI